LKYINEYSALLNEELSILKTGSSTKLCSLWTILEDPLGKCGLRIHNPQHHRRVKPNSGGNSGDDKSRTRRRMSTFRGN